MPLQLVLYFKIEKNNMKKIYALLLLCLPAFISAAEVAPTRNFAIPVYNYQGVGILDALCICERISFEESQVLLEKVGLAITDPDFYSKLIPFKISMLSDYPLKAPNLYHKREDEFIPVQSGLAEWKYNIFICDELTGLIFFPQTIEGSLATHSADGFEVDRTLVLYIDISPSPSPPKKRKRAGCLDHLWGLWDDGLPS
jgi:hypothetical protein